MLAIPPLALGDGVRVLGVARGADALRPLLAGTGRFAPLLELDPPRGARGGIVTLLCYFFPNIFLPISRFICALDIM